MKIERAYRIDRITIDTEFAALIAPPNADELALLEVGIKRDGLREFLTVWSDHGTVFLLDGHNRLRIMQAMGVEEVPVKFAKLPDREAAMLWIEENQAGRRNLTDDQRAMIWASILERRAKASRASQLEQARQAKEDPASVETKTDTTEKKEREREAVAKESGLPAKKLTAARKLRKEDPAAADDVRKGKKTLRQAKKESKTAKRTAFLSDLKVGDWVVCASGRNAGARGGWKSRVTELTADSIVVGRQSYDRKGKGHGMSIHIERLATPAEVMSAQEDARKLAELAAVKERAEEILKTQVPKGYRVNVRVDRGLENPAASIDLTFVALTTEKLEHIFKVLRETAPESETAATLAAVSESEPVATT